MVAIGPNVPCAIVVGGAWKGNSAASFTVGEPVAAERMILGPPFILPGEGACISSVSFSVDPSCSLGSRRGSSLPGANAGDVERGLRVLDGVLDSADAMSRFLVTVWDDTTIERMPWRRAVTALAPVGELRVGKKGVPEFRCSIWTSHSHGVQAAGVVTCHALEG